MSRTRIVHSPGVRVGHPGPGGEPGALPPAAARDDASGRPPSRHERRALLAFRRGGDVVSVAVAPVRCPTCREVVAARSIPGGGWRLAIHDDPRKDRRCDGSGRTVFQRPAQ